ncbi:MAG: hypothetical protein NTZ34_02735 [Chloroflexi bacterium]|nr:hypothetical protein [Chloroflexota bacterium]
MKKIITAFLASLIFASCQPNEPNEPEAYYDTAWTTTSIGQFAILGIHKDGSLMAIDTTTGADYSGRVILKRSPSSPVLAVWIDANGYPTLASMEGNFWIFENFTSTSVDVGIIHSDGTSEIAKAVSLPASIKTSTAQSYSPLYSPTTLLASPSLGTILKWAGHAVSIAACVIAVPSLASPAAILWALGCGSAIISTAADALDSDDTTIRASSSAIGSFSSAVGCTTGSVISCVSFFTNLAADGVNAAEGDKTTNSGIIINTRLELRQTQLFLDNFDDGQTHGWAFRTSSGLTQNAAHSGTYSMRVYDAVGYGDESECYKVFSAVSTGMADFWMYMPSNSPAPVTIYLSDQNVWEKHPNPRFWVAFNLNGTVQWNHASVWQDFPSAATFNFNVWNHIQILWDSVQNKMRFIINGKDHGTVSETYTGGYITQLVFMKGAWDRTGLFAYFDDVSVGQLSQIY